MQELSDRLPDYISRCLGKGEAIEVRLEKALQWRSITDQATESEPPKSVSGQRQPNRSQENIPTRLKAKKMHFIPAKIGIKGKECGAFAGSTETKQTRSGELPEAVCSHGMISRTELEDTAIWNLHRNFHQCYKCSMRPTPPHSPPIALFAYRETVTLYL